MKNLKMKSLFGLVILAAVVFSSCKKQEVSASPEKEILGNWVGKYSSGNNAPNIYFRFNIKQNGQMEVLDEINAVLASGTWTLNGDKFGSLYTYFNGGEVYNVSATYDMEAKKIVGKYGEGDDDPSQGKFYLDKQ